jgi:phage gp36-like protein
MSQGCPKQHAREHLRTRFGSQIMAHLLDDERELDPDEFLDELVNDLLQEVEPYLPATPLN